MKLVIVCVECGIVAHAPFSDEKLSGRKLFNEIGWILSLVEPPVAGKPNSGVLAPLCGPCSEKVYSPELLAAARKSLSGA